MPRGLAACPDDTGPRQSEVNHTALYRKAFAIATTVFPRAALQICMDHMQL